mmetsp:Transcript_31900/g.81674  ORF Transcript_31900/g.81674 Transcript_31900/m.81674 type:complete len:327 (+) Transcript_31900:566-1546(+)
MIALQPEWLLHLVRMNSAMPPWQMAPMARQLLSQGRGPPMRYMDSVCVPPEQVASFLGAGASNTTVTSPAAAASSSSHGKSVSVPTAMQRKPAHTASTLGAAGAFPVPGPCRTTTVASTSRSTLPVCASTRAGSACSGFTATDAAELAVAIARPARANGALGGSGGFLGAVLGSATGYPPPAATSIRTMSASSSSSHSNWIGRSPELLRDAASAPAASSSATASGQLSRAAKWSGVQPSMARASTRAPHSSKSLHISAWSLAAAWCSGVCLNWHAAFTAARPSVSISATRSVRPDTTACRSSSSARMISVGIVDIGVGSSSMRRRR